MIDDIHSLSSSPLPFPIVLKPYSGAGAKNTYVIASPQELESAVAHARQSAPRAYVAEEFIDGQEGHADGLIEKGRVRYLGFGEYLQNVVAIKSGAILSSVSPPLSELGIREEAARFVEASLGALGLADGVFHLELFRKGNEWIFSEAAMRCGGAGIPLYHEAVAGVSLFDLAACTGLGLSTQYQGERLPGRHTYTGWSSLPSPAGEILSYPERDVVLRRPGVVDVEFEVPPGRRFPDMALGSFVKVGSAVLEAESKDNFRRRQRDLTEWFSSEVRVR